MQCYGPVQTVTQREGLTVASMRHYASKQATVGGSLRLQLYHVFILLWTTMSRFETVKGNMKVKMIALPSSRGQVLTLQPIINQNIKPLF